MSVGRTLCQRGSELQQAEIFLSRHSLLQNLSTFSEGYVRTSGAATKHRYIQQELYFKKTSQARGSHKPEMRKRFLWNLNYCCPRRVRSV